MRIVYTAYEAEKYAWAIREADTDTAVAYVDCLTKRVFYSALKMESDPQVQEAVRAVLACLEDEPVTVSIPNRNGIAVTLKMKTDRGVFEACAEPKALFNGKKDAMYISFQPSEDPYVYADLLAAKTDGKDVELYVWSDVTDEDYQGDPIVIRGEEIDDLIESCKEE